MKYNNIKVSVLLKRDVLEWLVDWVIIDILEL